jgi:predicted dehydrogenase
MNSLQQRKIRFAFIGCGAIAHKHLLAISRFSNTEVVGVHDVNPQVLKEFSRKYSIPAFKDAERMVEEAQPHILNILTPSGLHAKNILELIRFNKHFVVEKPLALRLQDVDKVIAACDKKGVNIFVVQQNRFNPPIQKLKEALVKGRFGKLVLGTVRVRWCRDQAYYGQKSWRGTWSLDGGVLANQTSHHIDMLIWMMGDVESVVSKTARRLADIEAEDTGAAIIKFKNGALGIVEATTATRPKDLEGSISILGEKGAVEIGGFFMNELKVWNFLEKDKMDNQIWFKHAKVPEVPAWNHAKFFKDVLDSLKNGKRCLIDGLEARKSIELINAIYKSAETGKEVFLESEPLKSRLGMASRGAKNG